jgi:hypothetical protein
MTLATGQKPFMASRVNKLRLGASRLGYYQPWIKALINGVDRSSMVRVSECTITDELNNEPNIATVRVSGFTPVKGQEVKVYMGDTDVTHQLFGGRILSVEMTYEAEKPANVVWVCQCIDYTWLLNRRKVIKKYTSLSATAIVLDLISAFASGFTTVNVATGLATIDEITFTNDDVTDCLTRIAERIGGYWYVDYASDLHFFLTETTAAASITTALPRGMFGIVQGTDLSQIATRVTARGGGANTLSDVSAGGATIPVEDSSWYAGGGGTVEIGQNRVTYTGVASAGETGSSTGYLAPPGQLTLTESTGGSLTAGATYIVAGTYVTAEGETSSGVTQSVTLGVGKTAITYSNFTAPTDPKVTLKRIYISDANAGIATLKKFTDVAIATTTGLITGTGTGAIPTTNAAGFGSLAAAAGATSLQVADCAQFLSGGGWAEAPGGQVFTYTGRSVSSGPGNLTGIPASGVGSLTAEVRAGTVRSLAHLTGCSGITYDINRGDPVNIVVTVNDATAQTAMAGFVGGDGVHEMFISDGRWAITEATARANAELSLRKDPLVSIHFSSRDQSLQSGRDITITTTSPSISGTFKIQRVTLSELGLQGPTGWLFPLRQVEASSRRYSFEDVLRRLKERAT